MEDYKYKVAIADDHVLVRKGFISLINSFDDFTILFEADDGRNVIENINCNKIPDLLVLDVQMPGLDGYETAQWMQEHHPGVKILALTMYTDKFSAIRMLRSGARGYISKAAEPQEFKKAMYTVMKNGIYLSDQLSSILIDEVKKNASGQDAFDTLSEREMQFLQLLASDKSYKEIAQEMYLSPRTLDDYKKAVSQKVGIKTRIGLALYAVKMGFVDVMKIV
ncbi:MAG TPA: response regulator transcription factor [Chitinophagaceae bacterium]|nr:response regulator transcription factor [Chitinophagaceae bacterium]